MPTWPVMVNVGALPPGYDPKTHCSMCENPLSNPDEPAYVCETTGAKQCSWLCRVNWLEILSKVKDKN